MGPAASTHARGYATGAAAMVCVWFDGCEDDESTVFGAIIDDKDDVVAACMPCDNSDLVCSAELAGTSDRVMRLEVVVVSEEERDKDSCEV
jgi:hypothetical protein